MKQAFRPLPVLIVLVIALWLVGCGPNISERRAAVTNALNQAQSSVWLAELNRAFQQANETRKPILVTFTAVWCGPCHALDMETSKDQTFQAESTHWHLVKVDVDQHRAVAQQFLVQALPTLLLIDARTKQSERIERVEAVSQLVEQMTAFRSVTSR